MEQIRAEHFQVDVKGRVVRHKSGVEFEFYPYENNRDWLLAGPSHVRNPDLYDGNYRRLIVPAKQAALLNGMGPV